MWSFHCKDISALRADWYWIRVLYSLTLFVFVTVDPVREADHTDVAGRQEAEVTPNTETAVGVGRIIVTAATARRVALVARATKVIHAVVNEAAPAVRSVTTETNSRNPTMAWIVRRTTVKHPSLRDRQMTTTATGPNEKAVPKPKMAVDQKMVRRVHRLMISPAVAVTVAAVAKRQMTTSKVGGCSCCGVVTFCSVLSLRWTDIPVTGRYSTA